MPFTWDQCPASIVTCARREYGSATFCHDLDGTVKSWFSDARYEDVVRLAEWAGLKAETVLPQTSEEE